jgi:cell division protein FtsQ
MTEQNSTVATGLRDHLGRLAIALVICLLAYGSYFILKTVDRPLTRITIDGEFKYLNHQDLTVLVNDAISGGFLTVDLEGLQAVLQQHPWVDRASIERQWPSQLHIDVKEEVPIARWGDQAFLNRMGQSLNIADNSHLDKLPLLTAEFGESTEIMEQYQRLSELLLPTGLKLSELRLDSLGAWQVETNKGIRLVIGRQEIGKKIRHLVLIWESGLNLQSDRIETIDLRYPNGLAVAWRSTVAEGEDNNARTAKVTVVSG